MRFPTISLNGTDPQNLLDETTTAATALNRAIECMWDAAPNGRDFGANMGEAVREHEARIGKLREVLAELQEIAEHIANEQDAIASRKAGRA